MESTSLLRLECDFDDVRIVVVHRASETIDEETDTAENAGSEYRPDGVIRTVACERSDRSERQTRSWKEVEPELGVEPALDLNGLRLHAALIDGDAAAL